MATDVAANGGPEIGILAQDLGDYTWNVVTTLGLVTLLVGTDDAVDPGDAVFVLTLPGARMVAMPAVAFAADFGVFTCQKAS